MNDDARKDLGLWEYKWSDGNLDEMNRLGLEGWEAVGTNSATRAVPFGATLAPTVSVLFKRRYFAKTDMEIKAEQAVIRLLEKNKSQKKRTNSEVQNEMVECLACQSIQEKFYTFCKKCHGESFQRISTE
jgi:hypothetical protein